VQDCERVYLTPLEIVLFPRPARLQDFLTGFIGVFLAIVGPLLYNGCGFAAGRVKQEAAEILGGME